MNVVVVGCGHVGLVTAVGLADIGHRVVGVDSDRARIEMLREGVAPFYEPGLDEFLRTHNGGSLTFADNVADALDGADATLICVDAPPREDGRLSLVYVERAARAIAQAASGPLVVVERSTVPVQTARRIVEVLRDEGRYPEIEVATNPAFLREGTAVHDLLSPDRIVVGIARYDGRAAEVLEALYAPIVERTDCPFIVTDLETAELIKHASNSFLAMKISYINLVARFCEAVGADIGVVAEGMGRDPRIGPNHLQAGIGYGGFCLPKDLGAFVSRAEELRVDLPLLDRVREINAGQRRILVEKVQRAVWNLDGKVIAVWGLTYKPGTDDIRGAPSVDLIPALEQEGATVRAYDPAAGAAAKAMFPTTEIAPDTMSAVDGADALVILTEWPEFVDVDLVEVKQALRRSVIVDGRNLWPVDRMAELGFTYLSFGRPDVVSGKIRT